MSEFVSETLLQSTLREWKELVLSPRLALVFVAVVALFAVTGPFGTSTSLAFGPRLAYWLLIHIFAWTIVLTVVIVTSNLLKPYWSSVFGRMLTGATIAAFPNALSVMIIDSSWSGDPFSLAAYLQQLLYTLPLNLILCVMTYLSLSNTFEKEGPMPDGGQENRATGEKPIQEEPVDEPRAEVPLLRRLKPENRGPLLHISVEDHYSQVTTSRGRELILLRLSDAIAETGPTEGLQVHRSHWVADRFVTALRRDGQKLTLVLADGAEIPVSRTYAAKVREAFATRA